MVGIAKLADAPIGGFEVGKRLLELGEHVVIVLSFPEEDDGLNGSHGPIGGEISRLT